MEKSIEDWCKGLNLIKYEIIDGVVSVNAYVDLFNKKFEIIPIQFGRVNGDFYCQNNNLITLKGSPREVSYDFYCQYNELTSLEGGPKKVGENYYCHYNSLTTLEGGPKVMGKYFNCENNPVYENYSKYDNYIHYMRTIKLKELSF
jgi:hypothetical protein